jgi:uncharacterized protein
MSTFTPLSALAGGLLIGVSALLLMLLDGRIAGISGILGGLVRLEAEPWRVAFLIGLVAAPVLYAAGGAAPPSVSLTASPIVLVVGGLLVGIGTRLGRGCTSGHGVCGIARLSSSSLAATAIFMMVAGIAVFVARHVVGG